MNAPKIWTGKPCKRGHIALRYAANKACLECIAILENTEKKKLLKKQYSEKNREKAATYGKKYYKERKTS